jgi:proton glutamate symport protein
MKLRPKISLTSWILIGLIAGVLLGIFFPAFAVKLTPVSNIFLRLIKSIIGPLLFGTLVSGIASTGELKTMGRITAKALVYFEVVTTLALVIGLLVVNWLRPGAGMLLRQENGPVTALSKPASLGQIFEHAAPANIFEALAQNDVLQMVVFFFLFGAACSAVGAKAQPVVSFANAVAEVMFRYTNYVMYLAPFGVGAAIAVTIGSKGLSVLYGLGKLVGTLYLALAIFALLVLIPSLVLVRIPLRRFWRWVREPGLIAFSTASSEAALPVALENMEHFGAPKHIAGFVLPLGYSFNLTGTTLYLSLATMFIAQGAGLHVPVARQITMMVALMLTSKGVAGVPRAALVILAATVSSFQLPQEGITLLLGVDALLDMGRTCINVLGNCVATAVVAKWEPGHRAGSVSDLDFTPAHLNPNMK